MVDAVVLGATEVDLNFNANVVTHSDGRLLHGIGGWQNCLDAKCTILAVPSFRDRIPVIVDEVTTLTGPGETIDVIATERGIAIKLDPATLGTMGDAYAAIGDTSQAEQFYKTMEVAVTGQPGAYHRAWSLFLLDHDRRIPEVLANVRKEIETRKDVYGYDLLAWALHKEHRDAEARLAMNEARRLGTRDAMLFYHAGMIERSLGEAKRARYFLTMALEVNPDFHPTQPREARAVLDSINSELRDR